MLNYLDDHCHAANVEAFDGNLQIHKMALTKVANQAHSIDSTTNGCRKVSTLPQNFFRHIDFFCRSFQNDLSDTCSVLVSF